MIGLIIFEIQSGSNWSSLKTKFLLSGQFPGTFDKDLSNSNAYFPITRHISLLGACFKSPIAGAPPSPSLVYSPARCNTKHRRCGLTLCSNKNTPCHLPSASRPAFTGIPSETSVRLVRMWAGISSAPSAVW